MRHKQFFNGLIAVTGLILSPLTWWNDLFVNIPLAYLLATPFALISERFFLPAFVIGYWMTNIVGLVLFHQGLSGLLKKKLKIRSFKKDLLLSLFYTFFIVALILLGWLKSPAHFLR